MGGNTSACQEGVGGAVGGGDEWVEVFSGWCDKGMSMEALGPALWGALRARPLLLGGRFANYFFSQCSAKTPSRELLPLPLDNDSAEESECAVDESERVRERDGSYPFYAKRRRMERRTGGSRAWLALIVCALNAWHCVGIGGEAGCVNAKASPVQVVALAELESNVL